MNTGDCKGKLHMFVKHKSKIMIAEAAVKNIMAGAHIFIDTGCDEPQVLVHALADGLQMVLEE